MTELLIGSNPDDVSAVTTLPQTAEEKAKQLPEPSGYRILCAIQTLKKVTKAASSNRIPHCVTKKYFQRCFLLSKWVLIVTRTKAVSLLGHGAKLVTLSYPDQTLAHD